MLPAKPTILRCNNRNNNIWIPISSIHSRSSSNRMWPPISIP